jgi:tetratricopeptide (TPR) repeat protein
MPTALICAFRPVLWNLVRASVLRHDGDEEPLESRNEALWIYYFSGHMPETIQQCQKTSEIEPAAGLPYAVLAMAYARLGQREATVRAAENAMRFPDSPSVITTSASALAHVGESGQAKQFLGKALEMAKDRYVCRFLVAAAYTELGEKACRDPLEYLGSGWIPDSTRCAAIPDFRISSAVPASLEG